MTCLPEEFIYGWIFTLRSESKDLTEYKRTCYKLLYNHFHGTITNRKEILQDRAALDKEIGELKQSLKEEDANYKRLKKLQSQRKQLSTQLNSMDDDLIKQTTLFPTND